MFPVDAFRATLKKAVAILREHSIRFHLTGGITSVFYGEPRMTQDIDIVVDNIQLTKALPSFLQSLDSSDFIRKSIAEVRQTIFIALTLVILVIFSFLRDWRTTLVPVLVIPVSLVGTFFALYLAGFSLNVLSDFDRGRNGRPEHFQRFFNNRGN